MPQVNDSYEHRQDTCLSPERKSGGDGDVKVPRDTPKKTGSTGCIKYYQLPKKDRED